MAFFKNLISSIKRAFQGEPEDECNEDGIAKQREVLSNYQSIGVPKAQSTNKPTTIITISPTHQKIKPRPLHTNKMQSNQLQSQLQRLATLLSTKCSPPNLPT